MEFISKLAQILTLAMVSLLVLKSYHPSEVVAPTLEQIDFSEPSEDRPTLDPVAAGDLYGDYTQGYDWPEVLQALRVVETGAEPNNGLGALGDPRRDKNGTIIRDANGNVLEWCAYGPFQIWMPYFADATERQYEGLDTIDLSWEDCLNDTYASELIVMAYMRRYAYDEFTRLERGTATLDDVQKVARIHNGGPRGHSKSATLGYWAKVQEVL